jgi:hypothetical protein
MCQVLIKASVYASLLEHDSYIDCSQLYPFTDMELSKGAPVNRVIKENIRKAINNSSVIDERYKKLILAG